MLEAISYGLIALAVMLGAAFSLICVEEKATPQANRSPRLVDGRKQNSFSSIGDQNVSRSCTGVAGREELTGSALFLETTCPTCLRGTDENGPTREQRSSDVSHG